jgi:hypothetical protein
MALLSPALLPRREEREFAGVPINQLPVEVVMRHIQHGLRRAVGEDGLVSKRLPANVHVRHEREDLRLLENWNARLLLVIVRARRNADEGIDQSDDFDSFALRTGK